jgi:predicted enzyme related to lactoylglutathione lyase
MEKVTGIGGIFMKTSDVAATRKWYQEMLGIDADPNWNGYAFQWREHDAPDTVGQTIWSLMPSTTKYFNPSTAPFMVNYRVKDVHAMIAQLRAAGAQVDDKIDESEYGKFGWVMDPEGNRIELWEPPVEAPK